MVDTKLQNIDNFGARNHETFQKEIMKELVVQYYISIGICSSKLILNSFSTFQNYRDTVCFELPSSITV